MPDGSWCKNRAKQALDEIKRARDSEAQEGKEKHMAKKQSKRKDAQKKPVPRASKFHKAPPRPFLHAAPAFAAESPPPKGTGGEKRCVPKEAKKPPLKKGKAAQLPANAVVEIQDSDIEDGDEPGATLVVWVLSGDADDEASRESQQALLSWPDQSSSQDAANFKKKLSGFEGRAVDAAFALNHLGDAGIVSLASVAGGSSVDISARHFCRLKPRCLLTDEIVNVLMSIFRAENSAAVASVTARRRSHFFSSFFLQRIAAFVGRGFDETAARRWAAKCPGGDILSLESIFVPVHVSNCHWAFAVISPENMTISYFDSLGGTGISYLRILRRFVTVVAGDRTDIRMWRLCEGNSGSMPQQENGFDCGVFMCAMVRFLATGGTNGSTHPFEQRDICLIRRRFAYLILSMGTRIEW